MVNQNREKSLNSWLLSLGLFVLLTALLPVSIEGADKSQPLEKIRVAYSSLSGNMAPLWVSHERGFFRKYGLDTELVFIASGTTTAQALTSRDVVLAQMAGAGVLQGHLRGADIVLIGGLVNTLTFQFIVGKEIKQPDQLKGKSVGVTRYGSSTDFATRYALDKWELVPQKDVTIGEFNTMPNLLAVLESGKIQGAMFSAPFTLQAKRMGFPVLVNLKMLGLEFQHTGIATTRALIKSRPELIRNVMKAYVEGIHYYKTHRQESLAILEKYLQTSDAEALREVYEDIGLALTAEKPYPTLRGIQIMLRELAAVEAKAKTAKAEQFVDMSFVKELDSSGFIDALYKSRPAVATRRETIPIETARAGTTTVPQISPETKEKKSPSAAKPTGADGDREHTVVAGDTLSHIAVQYYGNSAESKWTRIYQANRDAIKNPNYIFVGQKIRIPRE